MKCTECNRRHRNTKHEYCFFCFKEILILAWLEGLWSGSTKWEMSEVIRNYLFELRGKKCEICGWQEVHPITGNIPVQIDHIDGNSENNSIKNLIILCPNHHSLTPTYGALNAGNGRAHRRQGFVAQ